MPVNVQIYFFSTNITNIQYCLFVSIYHNMNDTLYNAMLLFNTGICYVHLHQMMHHLIVDICTCSVLKKNDTPRKGK